MRSIVSDICRKEKIASRHFGNTLIATSKARPPKGRFFGECFVKTLAEKLLQYGGLADVWWR